MKENKYITIADPLVQHLHPLNLPPKTKRKKLLFTYFLTRSGQGVCSAHHAEGTTPSISPREISPASSRGDMSKQTNATPTRSNVSPDFEKTNPDESCDFITDCFEGALLEPSNLQRNTRLTKSRSLLRRLTLVLHRRESLDSHFDDDLALDAEIPIQDVFEEFFEEKMPAPVSRPTTPALKDYCSETTPALSLPTPLKVRTKIITSTITSSVPSVASSEGSMSSVTCDFAGCRRCSVNTSPKEMDKNTDLGKSLKTQDTTSTKSSDFEFVLSCMESAAETFTEGLAACSPSRNGKGRGCKQVWC